MSLYTPEVREFVRTRDWPKGFQLDIIEHEVEVEGIITPYLKFVLYRDNWLTFEPAEHLKITAIVKEVMETLRANRIPCYMDRMESRSVK